MENGTYIFEFLLRQNQIIKVFDDCINLYIQNGTINSLKVPELVLTIVSIINNSVLQLLNNQKINYCDEDIIVLLDHFYTYITQKITIEFNSKEVYDIYNISVKLSIMRFRYSKNNGLLCFKNKNKKI